MYTFISQDVAAQWRTFTSGVRDAQTGVHCWSIAFNLLSEVLLFLQKSHFLRSTFIRSSRSSVSPRFFSMFPNPTATAVYYGREVSWKPMFGPEQAQSDESFVHASCLCEFLPRRLVTLLGGCHPPPALSKSKNRISLRVKCMTDVLQGESRWSKTGRMSCY